MIFLGVDSGGTSTTFLLGDEQQELACVKVGSLKRMRVSAEEAEANLLQAITELERQSGIPRSSISYCCIGAAGDEIPLVAEWLINAFNLHLPCRLTMVNDAVIALDAAFYGRRGVVAIAGTGSNVVARTAEGQLIRCGGWGPALACQGSGHWLGYFGLRRGFLALDQQQPTKLLNLALAHWKLDTINDLVAYANQQPQPDFSTLAPLFAACADQGDAIAIQLLQDAGHALAEITILAIERLMAAEQCASLPPTVAVAGSVISTVHLERKALYDALSARFPAIPFVAEPVVPVKGALWRARKLFAKPADAECIADSASY